MNKKPLSPFQQALLDAQLEQWKDIPSEEDMEITLSEEFQEKGNEIIRRTKQGKLRGVSTAVRRVVLVAAIVATLAVTALAIPEVREEIKQLFAITNTGDHYEFVIDDNLIALAPQRIEKVYKPAYIPEGFQEEAIINTQWVVYMWQGDGGKIITFGQYPLSDKSVWPQPDSERLQVKELLLNGYKVFSMYSDSNRMYFWTDNTYFYRLICSSSISENEVNKIFDSIEENENAIIRK